MIQLNQIEGSEEAGLWLARRFPWRLGRGASNDVQLQADGIWDRHAEIQLRFPEGFELVSVGEAMATVNDQPTTRAWLRNGDIIGLGSLKVRFSLSPTRARRAAWREWLTWLGFAAMCLGQVALIYLLPS